MLILLFLLIFNINDYKLEVKSTDLDRNNHVNNSKYIDYLQDARWNWLEKHDITYEDLKQNNIIFSVVHIDIGFQKQCKYNDQLFIETKLVNITNKSFKLNQVIFRKDIYKEEPKEIVSEAIVTIVTIDSNTNKAIEISEVFRKKLNVSP